MQKAGVEHHAPRRRNDGRYDNDQGRRTAMNTTLKQESILYAYADFLSDTERLIYRPAL